LQPRFTEPHLSARDSPDYRNSFKESISAVEAACQIITRDPKATLGAAVKKLEDCGIKLHSAFRGALDEPTLDSDDARFMLVSCSAFVNYLKTKANDSAR
jgi:hypothetical protein